MIKKYLITIIIAILFTSFAIPYAFNQGRLYHHTDQNLMQAYLIAIRFSDKYSELESKYKDPASDYYLLSYMSFFDHLVIADQAPKEMETGEFLRKLNILLMALPELIDYENKQPFYINLWQCRILNNQHKFKIPNPEQLLARYNQSPYVGKMAFNFTEKQAQQAWQNLSCDPALLEDE